MKTLAAAALTLALLGLSGPIGTVSPAVAAGQPEAATLPDAASLFEKYIEVTGGMEAHRAHRDRTLHGIYRVLQTGDTQILTVYASAPNNFRAELESPGVGTTIRVTNGTDTWGDTLVGEPFLLPEADRAELLENSTFLGEAAYRDHYKSIQTTGLVPFAGTQAYKVDFETKNGVIGALYFDAQTGLVLGREIVSKNNPGVSAVVQVSEYKEFEGVMLPTIQRQRLSNQTSPAVEVEFRWIEVNTGDMPEFDPPEGLIAGEG